MRGRGLTPARRSERQMAGVPEDDVRDIVSNNAARIWGF